MNDANPPKPTVSEPEQRWRRFAKRPRPFQFSLRSLLIVVLLASIAMSCVGVMLRRARREQAQKEREAAIQAKWQGYGALEVSADEQGNVLWAVALHGPGANADNLLQHLEKQTKLQVLGLQQTNVSDDGLKHLKGMTSLREVELRFCSRVTDAGMEHLKGLPNLQNLGLNCTNITDAGLEHLGSRSSLRALGLAGTQVTDAGLIHLQGLDKLQTLHLSGTQVTDAGLEHLKGLTDLRYLQFINTQVTDEGVENLQRALPNCGIMHKMPPSTKQSNTL